MFLLMGFAIAPVAFNHVFMMESLIENQVENRIVTVQSQSLVLANEIAKMSYLDGDRDPSLDSEINQLSSLYEGRVLVINRNFRIIRDTYGLDEGKINISESVIQCFNGIPSRAVEREEDYLEFAQPIYSQVNNSEIIGCLIVGTSTESIYMMMEGIDRKGRIQLLIITILLFPVSFLLSGRLIRPFRKIAEAMEKSVGENLENLIMVGDYQETREISEAYNQTLARLKRVDESRQQFVSNVSHELKTPLTSIRVLADSLLADNGAPPEQYREFLGDISEEIDRESRIIEDLLSMLKLDKASQELNISTVNLNMFLEGLLKRLRPLAMKKKVELILESFRPVTAEVDEMKLSLALSNIIENAIKYNIEDGWVRVTLNADHKFFYVKVADTGIGIPKESQNQVFERFYRADRSRSRETGGTGLGLSITQSIVFLHHGAIKLHSEEGEGTTFTVRIPLIYIP